MNQEKEALSQEVDFLKDKMASTSRQLTEATENLGAMGLEVESLKVAVVAKESSLGQLKKSRMDEKAEVQRLGTESQKNKEVMSSMVRELKYRWFDDFSKKLTDDFKKTKDFNDTVVAEATIFMDRGVAHLVCKVYLEVGDPAKLTRFFSSCFFKGQSRQGASFVPFS